MTDRAAPPMSPAALEAKIEELLEQMKDERSHWLRQSRAFGNLLTQAGIALEGRLTIHDSFARAIVNKIALARDHGVDGLLASSVLMEEAPLLPESVV